MNNLIDPKIYLKINKKVDRIFLVPDIHGEIEKLQNLLNHLEFNLNFTVNDILIFLGDACDRGPDTCEVYETIIKFQNKYGKDSVYFIKGNHEDFMLDIFFNPKFRNDYLLWLDPRNGGRATVSSYLKRILESERQIDFEEDEAFEYGVRHFAKTNSSFWAKKVVDLVAKESPELARHRLFLESCPYAIELNEKYFFSHAPQDREKKRAEKGVNRLLRNKSVAGEPFNVKDLSWTNFGEENERKGAMFDKHEGVLNNFGTGDKFLKAFCGHIHRLYNGVNTVRKYPNYTLLDCGSGCGPDGKLSLYEVISDTEWYF